MVENTGRNNPIAVEDKGLYIRKIRLRIKQLEIGIETSEIRLIDMEAEKTKMRLWIETQQKEIEKLSSEIKVLEGK